MSDPNIDPASVEVTPTMTAKDRVRAWFLAVGLGEPYLTTLGPKTNPDSPLNDYDEPQLQVEYRARAAFWPRALFERDWPQAQAELVRFFIDGAAREAAALTRQNAGD